MSKHHTLIRTTDEHIIAPLMLMCTTFSLSCALYLLNELLEKEEIIKEYYNSMEPIEDYFKWCTYYALVFLLVAFLQILSLRFKKGWLYYLLVSGNVIVGIYFFQNIQ